MSQPATNDQINEIPVPLLIQIIRDARARPTVDEVQMMHTTNVKEMRLFFDALSSGKPAKEIYDVVLSYLRQRQSGVAAADAAKQAKLELENKNAREAAIKKEKEVAEKAARAAEEAKTAAAKLEAEEQRLAQRPRRPASDELDVIIDDQGDALVLTLDHKITCAAPALAIFDFGKSENLKFVSAEGTAVKVSGEDGMKAEVELTAKGEVPLGKLVVVDKSKNQSDLRYMVGYASAEKRARMAAASSTRAPPQPEPAKGTTGSADEGKPAVVAEPGTTPEEEDELQQVTPNLKLVIKSKGDGYELFFENSEDSTAYFVSMDFTKSTNLAIDAPSAGSPAKVDGMKASIEFLPAAKGKLVLLAVLKVADYSLGECELVYTLSQRKRTAGA